MQTTRRGRPPAAEAMDRAELVARAADLADQHGWEALTLSRLARENGRHASSMYSHVSGLADLQRAVSILACEEIGDAVWRAALGKTGRAALSAIAEEYRRFAADHPGRTVALSAIDENDPDFAVAATRMHEPLRAAFASFGLDDEAASTAHRLFGALVNGLVSTHFADEMDAAVDLFVAAMSTGDWP